MISASALPPITRAPRSGVFGAGDFGISGTDTVGFFCGRMRPGTYSSRTVWKLVPPNPKALIPARRGSPFGFSQGFSVVLT